MIDSLYDKFKPWSEKCSIWIMSDPHFEDFDCKMMDENWVTPQEQVKRINRLVSRNDTLILLGDIGNVEWVKKLRGKKILIAGNHDTSIQKNLEIFDEVYEGPVFIGAKILLSHEPIDGLDFCFNIHGHSHGGKMRPDAYHLNLAANVCDYTPVNLKKLIEKEGILSKVKTIHRETIDNAIRRKARK